MARVAIIDDDPRICDILEKLVESLEHSAFSANKLDEGLKLVVNEGFDLVLLDLLFPEGNGLRILPDLANAPSQPEIIIITGGDDNRGAELAFKHGAWDYVRKPFLQNEVILPITRALEYRKEKRAARQPLNLKRSRIIGNSSAIRSCLDEIARAAVSEANVLITGETGTGKELFARAIHDNGRRFSRDFVTVDCGAMTETLVESTLFGHEKGAFTGADKKQKGLIEQANGGSLFLDEVGELSLSIQKALLRTLQERRVRPVGGGQEVSVDFRLVAATNRDLEDMNRIGEFRNDLLYRIRAMEIELPSLRERGDDIREIAIHRVHHLCRFYGFENKGISPQFLKLLLDYSWPGNVRELINVLEYAIASAGNDPTLVPKHLPPSIRSHALTSDTGNESMSSEPSKGQVDTLDLPTLSDHRNEAERRYLYMLLEKCRGNRAEASRLSGVSLSRLYGLLKKHGLSHFGS